MICSEKRCQGCSFFSDLRCEKLVSIENSDINWKILLIEPGRGLIYFKNNSKSGLVNPPWLSDGWETVFVGETPRFFENDIEIVEVYVVGPYLSVFYAISDESHIQHESISLMRSPLERNLLYQIMKKSMSIVKNFSKSRIPLSERLQQMASAFSEKIVESIPEISELTRNRITEIAAHQATVIAPFFPILLDDEVEEVFLDRPGSAVYFDHRRLGRCRTNFTLKKREISSIATLIRAESNLHLDRKNPSLKTELILCNVPLRFSLTLHPLTPDKLHLEIRRPRAKPYSIINLIHNGTLSIEIAAILLLAVGCRFNITITGAPGTGKTTLLNALDMSTPRIWRKVYIEDTVESRVQPGHHQIRVQVDPVDEKQSRFRKSLEIDKTLHRSPDYIILGEIQTAKHSKSLFQAMTAGLRTMQTCHSDSAASLISRWTSVHEIKESNIALMDVIVTLDRPKPGTSKRIVKEVVEIKKQFDNGLLLFGGLNKLYDSRDSKIRNWANNGAFFFRAQEIGISNHLPAYNRVLKLLRKETALKLNENGPIGEKLWAQGHPMKFSSFEKISDM